MRNKSNLINLCNGIYNLDIGDSFKAISFFNKIRTENISLHNCFLLRWKSFTVYRILKRNFKHLNRHPRARSEFEARKKKEVEAYTLLKFYIEAELALKKRKINTPELSSLEKYITASEFIPRNSLDFLILSTVLRRQTFRGICNEKLLDKINLIEKKYIRKFQNKFPESHRTLQTSIFIHLSIFYRKPKIRSQLLSNSNLNYLIDGKSYFFLLVELNKPSENIPQSLANKSFKSGKKLFLACSSYISKGTPPDISILKKISKKKEIDEADMVVFWILSIMTIQNAYLHEDKKRINKTISLTNEIINRLTSSSWHPITKQTLVFFDKISHIKHPTIEVFNLFLKNLKKEIKLLINKSPHLKAYPIDPSFFELKNIRNAQLYEKEKFPTEKNNRTS